MRVANDTQKIQSSDWPKWCVTTLHNIPPFVRPEVTVDGLKNVDVSNIELELYMN